MKGLGWLAGIVAAGALIAGSTFIGKGPASAPLEPTPLAPSTVQAGSTLVDCGEGQNVLLRQANGVTRVQCVPAATMGGAQLVGSGSDLLQPIPIQANAAHGAPAQVQQASYAPRPAPRTTVRRAAPGRSWKKSAAIVGGATAAGAGVGAILDGGSGAKKGAVVGLVGGVVYDIATRNR